MKIARFLINGPFILIAIGVALSAYALYLRPTELLHAHQTPEETDVYVRFDMEIFDIISKEYWQKASDADLFDHFKLSIAKVAGTSSESLSRDRGGTARLLKATFDSLPEEKKKQFAIDIGVVALANLAPLQRNNLLSQDAEQDFRDDANNVDSSRSLYAVLDIPHGAPKDAVQKAYEEKKIALETTATPEARADLMDAERAREVLTNDVSKQVYDATKIEPTVMKRLIGTHTLYLDVSKVSPASFNEFLVTLQEIDKSPSVTSLIIDLRGNIGGTFDFVKYVLALFIGPQQYAFDVFRKGEYVVERTPAVPKITALAQFRDIAILTDTMTQSTAEVFAAVFKRLNRAQVIGSPTRGWGSIENTYPITTELTPGEKYLVLLVNSLTLDDDNVPIEGRGVTPDVDIRSTDWKHKVREAFEAPFSEAVIQEVSRGR